MVSAVPTSSGVAGWLIQGCPFAYEGTCITGCLSEGLRATPDTRSRQTALAEPEPVIPAATGSGTPERLPAFQRNRPAWRPASDHAEHAPWRALRLRGGSSSRRATGHGPSGLPWPSMRLAPAGIRASPAASAPPFRSLTARAPPWRPEPGPWNPALLRSAPGRNGAWPGLSSPSVR